GFVLGDGTPVRFWAVNVGPEIARQENATLDYMARKPAKNGVNMVRFHGPRFRQDDYAKMDEVLLERVYYLIAALKRNGIYTTVSFYFPHWMQVRGDRLLPGFANQANKHPFALIYFDPAFQQLYHTWARHLLTTPNP